VLRFGLVRSHSAALSFALLVCARLGAAQSSPAPLAVGGTLGYNLLRFNRTAYAEGRAWSGRFAGRLAITVRRDLALGFGVGSWARETAAPCLATGECPQGLSDLGQAIITQAYAQYYPAARAGFVRGGIGLANTRTLLPDDEQMRRISRWRAALTCGGGADLRIANRLYLTPSLDYTVILGTHGETPELHSALGLGVGITVR